MAKVMFRHLRALDYCLPRIREWCKTYGLNIREFREGHGMDSEKIRATGCGFGIRAAELAEQEEKENGR